MRVLIGCALLAIGLVGADVSAQETKKEPKDRVERKKAPAKDEVKVYTNADLEKFKIVKEEDDGETPATPPPADPKEAKKEAPPDPLQLLRQQQAAQRDRAKAIAEAEAAVTTAKEKLANLERQLLATRNPFAARPEISKEEKAQRAEGGETAAQRYDRTKEMVEKAREELRNAEGELARLRAGRP